MTIETNSGIFGVQNLVIYKLLTDKPGECPTYDTGIPVPGISALKMSKKTKSVESRGDEMLLDTEDIFESLDISWDNEIMSMAAAVAIGGLQAIKNTPAVAGTSPELNTIIEGATNTASYFMIKCEAKRGTDTVQNVGVEIFKVKGVLDADFVGEGYAKCSFKGTGIAIKGTIEGEVNAYKRLTFSGGEIAFKPIALV